LKLDIDAVEKEPILRYVIPADAGIYFISKWLWIPASSGMTVIKTTHINKFNIL
jgi:hypothetical protein